MMDVAYHYNDFDTCAEMEVCAIDVCKRCTKKIIEVHELEAICRLYRVIFQTRYNLRKFLVEFVENFF